MIKQRLLDFSELVMFKHSIFSLPFIFTSMVVAAEGWFGWKLLFLGFLAAISARNFAMGVNRYLDRDIDIINPRTSSRPSVDGRISSVQILLFVGVNAFIFVAVAYFVNPLALQVSIPILLILALYSLFKRFSAMAHLILGVSLGLAPIAGVIAVSSAVPNWSIYLALGVMFWVAGFDLLYSLQDIDFDRSQGLHSIPSRFGVQKTMWMARTFHCAAVVLWGVFVYESGNGVWAVLAVVVGAISLSYEHYLVSKDFTRIDKAFFVVNGYLGFLFLLLIVLDNM